jgi:hypothetical protein
MVPATVHCPPRKAWRASTTGCKRHVVTCRAEFLVQTPEALGVLRDGTAVFLKDAVLCRGGTDDFREPPEGGRAPIGPARRADILAEHEGFASARGIFEIADRIFARPREIPDRFIVHFGAIHGGEVP